MIKKILALFVATSAKIKAVYLFLGLPKSSEIKLAIASFSPRQRIILSVIFFIFIIGSITLLFRVNNGLMVKVAISGGNLTEGIIGTPRFINPLLAVSDADRDLSALIYSGLTRFDELGRIVPDLAKDFSVSADGLTYTFTLRKNLTWHDGKPITTNDIEYTIKRAQDPIIKSAKRANWEGVTIQKISDQKIAFILKKPYPAFLENTTLGILPKHLWQKISEDSFSLNKLNSEPVGSGPYQFAKATQDSFGVPQYYELNAFDNFAGGAPKISSLTLRFYPNDKELFSAYQLGQIDSLSAISPALAKNLTNANIVKIPLPRLFAVFLNQNQASVLANKEVREALNLATDKQALIDETLFGFGQIVDNAFPPGTAGYQASEKSSFDLAKAKSTLIKAGWKQDSQGVWEKKTSTKKETRIEKLTFTIDTSNIPEVKAAAEVLKKQWSKLGVPIGLRIFESGDLNENVLRPRKFEALLFGEAVSRQGDPFPFWHSSQRLDPGLNIAMYTNAKADKYLEAARTATKPEDRLKQYQLFQNEIKSDQPAIFLYSPYFLYVLPDKIKGARFSVIAQPADRFNSIHKWYLKTDQVWRLFAKHTDIIEN